MSLTHAWFGRLASKLLIQYVWIDQLVVIGVGGDFKAFVVMAFDAMFFFNTSDHILANIMPLFTQMSMQTLNTIALFSFTVSGSNQ